MTIEAKEATLPPRLFEPRLQVKRKHVSHTHEAHGAQLVDAAEKLPFALVMAAMALGCFYYALTYTRDRHGELRSPGGDVPGSFLISEFIDRFFGADGWRRVGFALGGLMFAALTLAYWLEWL